MSQVTQEESKPHPHLMHVFSILPHWFQLLMLYHPFCTINIIFQIYILNTDCDIYNSQE